MFFGYDMEKFLLLLVVAALLIGPERLPRYAESLARLTRRSREWLAGARTRVKEEMGDDFDEVEWRKLDPRQYDPRRIVREALADTWEATDPDRKGGSSEGAGASGGATVAPGAAQFSGVGAAAAGAAGAAGAAPQDRLVTPRYDAGHDPALPVPYDAEAT